MNDSGHINQTDIPLPHGGKADSVSLLAHSNLDNIHNDNPTTAEPPSDVDERGMLETQKTEVSSDANTGNDPANREIEPSVSTSPPTTGELIDVDDMQYDDATQNSSRSTTPPPPADGFDKWLFHTGFEVFASDLHEAAKAVFPNTAPSRYRNVYVLMFKWEDEDPNLPVWLEIRRLFDVFTKLYHFQTEIWDIKDLDCHVEVNQKILDFTRLGGASKEDLKVVYYAGHGKLTKNRLLSWTSWRNNNKSKCPAVKWSGIQNALEESRSDVLLLLDCCHAGTTNTNEGNGITEIIAACSYNSKANGVGPYSFTHALVIELEALASRTEFSTGELYNNIYCRTQIRLPDDGAGTERHPAPIHLVLHNDSQYRRSIYLSGRQSPENNCQPGPTLELNAPPIEQQNIRTPPETLSTLDTNQAETSSAAVCKVTPTKEFPRLALAIRFNDDLRLKDLSTDIFVEWLRTMPLVAQQVRVEAGFESFSSLLIVSIPIFLFAYLSYNPAVTCLGPITSSNLVDSGRQLSLEAQAGEMLDDGILHGVAVAEQHPGAHELFTETDITPWGRRQSNAPSISSSISNVTSIGTEASPPAAYSQTSRSPGIYPTGPAPDNEDIPEYLTNLEGFGDSLKLAGADKYPFEDEITYSRVSCLLFSWASEDANLPQFPQTDEVLNIGKMLKELFNFDVEHFSIPPQGSHVRVWTKITDFLKNEDPTHLKIVYYGGGGKVFADGHSRWTSNRRSSQSKQHSTVEWSRIFCKLESSISDVLILLDCTGAGSYTSTTGRGVTELIAASAFKECSNNIKNPSFTGVLINTLERLSRMPSFTVNYLYNCLLEKCHADRRPRKYKVDPVHIILGQETRRLRSIRFPTGFRPDNIPVDPGVFLQPFLGPAAVDDFSSGNETAIEGTLVPIRASQAPALFLTIRIPEFTEFENLSADLFREWLRELPIPTDSVVVQWGTVSC